MKFVLIISIFLASCQSAKQKLNITKKKVVLISIDGFRPEFYQDKKFKAPTLQKIAKEGFAAKGMVSVFPSVTYPNHTTIVTGKHPSEHGITSNLRFNFESGPTTEWYWDSKHIKSETLWDILKKNKKKSAAIHWPVTLGAPVDYLVPEIFTTPPWHTEKSSVLVKKYSTPGLPEMLNQKLNLVPYTNMKEADAWGAKAIKFLYETYQPELSAFHIIYADKNQHETGRDSVETQKAVAWIDQQLKPFIDVIDTKTCLIILGDHGFFDYTKVININKLFVDKGWIKIDKKGKLKSWKVIAHKSGAQAAIYLKDKSIKKKAIQLLKSKTNLGFEYISKSRLQKRKTYANAIAAVSAKEGFSFGTKYQGRLVEKTKRVKGQHGHLPEQKKMHTGFLARNCDLKQGELPDYLYNTMVTPLIMKYLGLSKN